ncbi:hypothetical protein TPHA_0F00750 [Tetrapisispora phaffii CBS 4417]|uniref:GOLD domain-containing protein n=1 Tax=Tetrapisispora phaffii (strain ATCC 24235 / CBS 4417 / NBRC 1672 / NRRL Y-8282 / UCD 70-5) TaxID=1071381 RepID=G8BUX9_TETPH|nr:hypothetical protein TPHA_0F00750 [Tetrapisispora phaffii CBS 4417]CCE63561.1 hypothetical protein TPHA_0F00750 [Tetrapisispora phaffii CBS 4417]
MQLVNFIKFALLCVILPTQVLGFYYYGNTGDRKCFIKELSKGTLLEGKYAVQTFDEELKSYRDADSKNVGIVVDIEEIFDDNHRVVHQKNAPVGDFTFIALDSGEHRICLETTDSSWVGKTKAKVSIDFSIGSDSKFDSKKKKTVKSLHQKVNYLNMKVDDIRREQALVREREYKFRDISESVNSKAMWWTILQLCGLIGICVWQMKSLRSFFVKQKVL